ncbi:MAG: alanine--tRNA ligase [Firmicutes bacterium]|nr:alanine--tRNA ligase [Bacillota bacterium]
MKTNDLRQAYLRFFESKGHKILPSASLIPGGDPTLLLTAAGMVPFKPFFLGTAKPDYTRVTTCQKCVRTPDIENVGKTTRHATFFEMLGNFSFGDYFKAEAIAWAWEFVTVNLGFDAKDLWVTIYLDDDEAFRIWNQDIGVPADRIVRKGKPDNFWEIGVGPCGPCSEIHVDRGPSAGCGRPGCDLECGCDRFMEIWNLVFIQFHRDEHGNYHPLATRGIDTGMGLERTAALLRGVESIFDTDETSIIRDSVADLAGVKYGADKSVDVAVRVITDHARGSTFMVSDGILPTNEGRGYVLRRLIRRAARFGRLIGIRDVFLPKVAQTVIDVMKGPYPELEREHDRILRTIELEEERFGSALEQGSAVLESVISRVRAAGGTCVPGADAFRLYDTYGFPYELTQDMAEERGFTVDRTGFDQAMADQRERARAARGESSYLDEKSARYKAAIGHLTTEFTGYEKCSDICQITGIIGPDGDAVDVLKPGESGEIVLDRTPFYAESGGQIADEGEISKESKDGQVVSRASVRGVSKPIGDAVVHRVEVAEGEFRVGDVVLALVDPRRRAATMRNHTATHLLHAALRKVLGSHVQQAGSSVDPERLRFDFSHFEPVRPEQRAEIERIVNEWVLANVPVDVSYTDLETAKRQGAIALFDEKYGREVRMVRVGREPAQISLELCGGTHVARTGDIGLVKIVSEGGIASGVRRIEAVTGMGALEYLSRLEAVSAELSAVLKAPQDGLADRVGKLVRDLHDAEREIARLRQKLAGDVVDTMVEKALACGDVRVVAARVEDAQPDALRDLADRVRERLGSGIVLLGGPAGDKVSFVAAVTPDLVKKGYNAGSIVRDVAREAGGGGGGRADLAMAGGRDLARLDQALARGVETVRAHQTSLGG